MNSFVIELPSTLKRPVCAGYLSVAVLDQPIVAQHDYWQRAWSHFFAQEEQVTRDGYEGPDVFLTLHGCYTRGHYGTRLVADPREVARFRPHLIVTFIDDIFDLWWRTEERAHGDPWRGRPTLEHLALARRVEASFGDLVKCLADTRPRHLLVAAAHPQRTVAQAIYGNRAEVAYLSSPSLNQDTWRRRVIAAALRQ